ncbi:DUF4350 domain-containing protein [Ideonella sp. BN130291]|uniref:DUF4350 domain-containing protein n=1 Tax=Ideonella sp. BN130291 TaxID=3112940 RepID=UPI002E26311C|nr:DUF4350 domain-containing protein [Ideonella sp. BN130291]
MSRTLVWRLLAVLLALGAAYGLFTQTEWVETEVPLPPRGEAARNRGYAAMQLLRSVGAEVVRRDNLEQLPPPGATLVLMSGQWSLFPGRDERLRDWVAGGGHLALPRWLLRDEQSLRWLPLKEVDRPKPPRAAPASAPQGDKADDEEDEDEDEGSPATPSEAASSSGRRLTPVSEPRPCETQREPDTVQASFDDSREFSACRAFAPGLLAATKGAAIQWSLDGRQGPESMRVAMGRGSVTVYGSDAFLTNRALLEGDNALILLAGLGLPGRGTQVWFVIDETRPALPVWVWQQAGVVVILAAAALAAALWRSGMRFGPLAAPSQRGRRSMAEQIHGTAQFLARRQPAALHAAQLRALDEAAQRLLRGWAHDGRSARALALARATGLAADELARAMDPSIPRPRTAWPPALALLEEARRRLLARQRPPSPASDTNPQDRSA